MTTYINTEFTNYVKDGTDGRLSAILNTDSAGYSAFRIQRDRNKKIKSVVEEVDELKADVTEIKNLLKELLGRSNG